MAMSARMQLAKRLASSLDSARRSLDESGMATVRADVISSDLVWQVNQFTVKLLLGHIREHTRELRLATKNKDLAEIERLTVGSKGVLQLQRLATTALMSSSKENPGDIVF